MDKSTRSSIAKSATFTVQYAKGLVGDVPEERLCEQPAGVTNHAAWVIGHIATSNLQLAPMVLGTTMPSVPEGWDRLFGIKSTPHTDRGQYPTKAALLEMLEVSTTGMAEAYANASDQLLAEPNPIEGLARMFPTKGDVTVFCLTAHPAMHLGQLSAWRRAAGYKSVF